MANELPFFRFTVQAWQNGKISLESYEHKGLFIDVCGYYWVQDCSITKAMLYKRFRDATELIDLLFKEDIIKSDEQGNLSIDFLNEQFDLLSQKRKNKQMAGKLGGLAKASNAIATLKQKSSYKDKEKYNNKNKDNNKKEPLPGSDLLLKSKEIIRKVWQLFPEKIRPDGEGKKLDSWIKEIELLIKLDGHTEKEIIDVIKWAREDDFWKDQFLSPIKLRRKNKDKIKYFEYFKIQMNGKRKKTSSRDDTKRIDPVGKDDFKDAPNVFRG